MSLGLKRGAIQIVEYAESWKNEYLEEKEILVSVFKSNFIEIEHIGSTAIPNSKAKPILDIAIKVKELEACTNEISELTSIGYKERVGRLKGKQKVFAKGGDSNVTHHLHIIEEGEDDWQDKIDFRDLLLSNWKVVLEYNQLKEVLLSKYPQNRLKYTMGKESFIKSQLRNYRK